MGLAIGIGMSGSGIGQLVMAPLIQLALKYCGLNYTFMLIGASMTLCVIPIYMIHYETSRYPVVIQSEKSKSFRKIYKEIFGSLDIMLMLIFLGNSIVNTFNEALKTVLVSIVQLHLTSTCIHKQWAFKRCYKQNTPTHTNVNF